jgi:tetratricopeptide (TPR) repeat protein
MSEIYNSKKVLETITNIHNKNFEEALRDINLVVKEYPNINITDWENAIEVYKSTLTLEINKEKILTNIGVFLFKLGKINQSITIFKNLTKKNPNFILGHNNLGISYLEIGMFQQAIHHFVLALNIDDNDFNARKNLINILTLSKPCKLEKHELIDLNNKIIDISNKNKINNFYEINIIKNILKESFDAINEIDKTLFLNETQIFTKNEKNLNCFRHFKIFNKFNIIPEYCFSCYKVQINLFQIVDLIKLYLMFDSLYLENNNLKKCMVETRKNIKGNYKGYIYCEGLKDAENIFAKVQDEILKLELHDYKMTIKHGCSEFYNSYPDFEKINFKGQQIMNYDKSWKNKEKLIDDSQPIRLKIDEKKRSNTLKGINLADILTIRNWINYADTVEDYSYKKIFDKKIEKNFINKVLEGQETFRKVNFN